MDFQTNQPDVYPGMDSQVDTAGDFKKIADETINRNKLDAARQPYDELRRLGFGADEIGAAWARRQAEAKDAGCEDKFMPQLRKWLLDTSVKGCQKMVEAARQRAGRGEKHLRRLPTAPGSSSATGRSIRLWMRTESSIAAMTRRPR